MGLLTILLILVVGSVLFAIIFAIIKKVVGLCFTLIGVVFNLILWVVSAPFRLLFGFLFGQDNSAITFVVALFFFAH